MIQSGTSSFTSLLLAGPVSSGKTALAVAFSKTLPANTFTQINATTLRSAEINEAEALTVAVRRSIQLKIVENKDIFTGVVTKINCQTFENGVKISVVQKVNLTLQTKKQTLEVKLDGKIYNSLQQQNVQVNDVIYIDKNAGFVKRLGRVTTSEKSLISDVVSPMPDGFVRQQKSVVQYVSLNELDQANAQIGTPGLNLENFYSNLPSVSAPTQKLRDEIDRIVIEKVQDGSCEVLPGVLFIDEASNLSLQACSYLNQVQEARFHPFIIYASNRGISQINNSEQYGLYGLPNDLLDRCLIITCQKQEDPIQLQKILELRSQVEEVKINEDAMKLLVDLAKMSLRYSEELISICEILRQARNGDIIEAQDVQEAQNLFKMRNVQQGDGIWIYSVRDIFLMIIMLIILITSKSTLNKIDQSLAQNLGQKDNSGFSYILYNYQYVLVIIPIAFLIVYIILVKFSTYSQFKKTYMMIFPFILVFGSLIIVTILIICLWFAFKRVNPYHSSQFWQIYTDQQPNCLSQYTASLMAGDNNQCMPYSTCDIKTSLMVCSVLTVYKLYETLMNIQDKNEIREKKKKIYITSTVLLLLSKIFYYVVLIGSWISQIKFGFSYFSDTCLGLIITRLIVEIILLVSRPSSFDNSLREVQDQDLVSMRSNQSQTLLKKYPSMAYSFLEVDKEILRVPLN